MPDNSNPSGIIADSLADSPRRAVAVVADALEVPYSSPYGRLTYSWSGRARRALAGILLLFLSYTCLI